MNSPLVTVLFLAIMSLLAVTLLEQQEAHRADMEARRVAEIIREVAQLQRAHYQASNALDPAERFLTQVKTPRVLVEEEIDDLSGDAKIPWAWFHALPDDPVNKTHADDKNRFSTWATRRWLRSSWMRGGDAPLDNSGLPLPEPGTRRCCVVDPGSVQVIYEARDAHAAGRVARQFGPSACLGRPHTHGTPRPNWLSYECAQSAGADDRYAIVHFSAPASLTIVDGFMYNKQTTQRPSISGGSPPSARPMYGDLVLRKYRPQRYDRNLFFFHGEGSTLYDPVPRNPVTASIHEDGYVYAPGRPDIRLGESIGFEQYGRRPVQIDANGDLRIGFGADEQILLDAEGLELSNEGGPALSLKSSAGTRTLSGVGSLHVEGTVELDMDYL